MARATTSLPVPDSPWTSTVAELPATRASSLYTSSMAGLWPTNAYGPTACGSTKGSETAVSLATERSRSSARTSSSRRSGSERTSSTPDFSARSTRPIDGAWATAMSRGLPVAPRSVSTHQDRSSSGCSPSTASTKSQRWPARCRSRVDRRRPIVAGFAADCRRFRPRRRPRESARAPTPPYPALRTGPRAPCEPLESSPRPGAAQIPSDEHERIIRALAVASEDLLGELLRPRLVRQALSEALSDTVGGEDERIAGSDGKDDRVQPRQLGPHDAAARHQTRPCGTRPRRAVAVQQQAFDVADAEPRHRALGAGEHRHAHHRPARPLERAMAALDERYRRFGRVPLQRGDGGLRRGRRR